MIGAGAREIASMLRNPLRLTAEQEMRVAELIQYKIDMGHMTGSIVTGDHLGDDGRTVLDWTDL